MKHKKLAIFSLLLFIILMITSIHALSAPVFLEIDGLGTTAKNNVTLLLTRELNQTIAPTENARIQEFFTATPEYVAQALKPYGYFHPTIVKQLSQSPQGWSIRLHIDPGPIMKLSKVQVQIIGEGTHDPAFQHLLHEFPVKAGQNLNATRYQKAKNAIYNLAAERGYFDGKFVRSQMIINLTHDNAQIVFVYDTGIRYRFGPTHFLGSTTLCPDFLQRYLTYQLGDYYENTFIQQTQQDLASSNYFKGVAVTPAPEHAINGQVPIRIHLVPSNPRQYTVGLGYGTDTGPRGTLGLQLRQINGQGHYFNALLRASQKNSSLSANYVIPGYRPAIDFYTISAALGEINQVTGQSKTLKVGPSYTTQLWRQWSLTLGAYYLNEHYNLKDLPKTDANLEVNYFHLGHIHQQTLVNPRQGYDLNIDIAGGPSLSYTRTGSFAQERVQTKGLYTLPTDTRLIGRSELGRTDIQDIENLPLSLQLFAGGANSIRGFNYNSIGPGRNLLVLSSEIQQRVYKQFYLAAFYDVGNVGDTDFLSDLKHGAGPGVVWLSPIGSVEFTIARRLSRDIDHASYQIQFSMGPDL